MTSPSKPFAKQARSKRSEERILDASERLLSLRTWEHISVANIAEAASMSVGGVYARFASKDALLSALHVRYTTERTEAFEAFFSQPHLKTADLQTRIKEWVSLIVDLFHARRGVLRTFVLQVWSDPDTLGEGAAKDLTGVYDQSIRFLLESADKIQHPNSRNAVQLAMTAIVATLRETLILKPAKTPGAFPISRTRLKSELSHLALSYLQTPST